LPKLLKKLRILVIGSQVSVYFQSDTTLHREIQQAVGEMKYFVGEMQQTVGEMKQFFGEMKQI